MHAVIDNLSRRILASTVSESFDTGVTARLLSEAANGLTDTKPNAVMDSGIENINASVDALIVSGITASRHNVGRTNNEYQTRRDRNPKAKCCLVIRMDRRNQVKRCKNESVFWLN